MDHIEVWRDTISDPSNPVWIVSLCREDGGEITRLVITPSRRRADADVAIAPIPLETAALIAEVEPKLEETSAAPADRPKREIHAGDLVIVDEGPIPGARLAARNRQGLAVLRKYEKEYVHVKE